MNQNEMTEGQQSDEERQELDAIIAGVPGSYEISTSELGKTPMMRVVSGTILEGGIFGVRDERIWLRLTHIPTGRGVGSYLSERLARLAARELLAIEGLDWTEAQYERWEGGRETEQQKAAMAIIKRYREMDADAEEAA
jgi:hypothetical protein